MKKLLIPIMVLVFAGHVQAGMPNPADVYCLELGYQAETITEENGGQYSVCFFPDGDFCDAWKFLEGTCGVEYSYCALNNYDLIVKTDGKNSLSRTYAVCVDRSNRSTEIGNPLDLMGITEALTTKPLPEDELPPISTAPEDAQPVLPRMPGVPPPTFDWRNHNGDWMTPVKNQSACGSCWAFTAVGTMEAAYNLHQNQANLDINLSEEYVNADCNGHGSSGCCGGWHDAALSAIRDNGVPDEACLVYNVGGGTPNGYHTGICSCYPNPPCNAGCPNGGGTGFCSLAGCDDACFDVEHRLVHIDDWYNVGDNVDDIKAALISHGPLGTALNWGFAGSSADGVFYCDDGNSISETHCVIIAGWDDNVLNGLTDGSGNALRGAWLIKNSHGNNDDGDGYRLVAYDDCRVQRRAVWVQADADTYFPSISVPNGVDFGDNCADETVYETLNICNTGMTTLSVYEIASDNAQFQVTDPLMDCQDLDGDGVVEIPDECSGGYPVNISPDFCYPFEVAFSPTGAAGQRTATLTVRSSDIGKPALSVPASGNVLEPDIAVAIADSGDFGDVCTGAFADLNLSLLNQGDCDLTISSITVDDSQFALPSDTTYPLVLSPDADFNLPVRFEPDACGSAPITGTITIYSDDPDESPLQIDVSGSSPCPDIQVAIANSGDFGAVCKGDFADLNLTLFNQGMCNLTISNIELIPDAGSFELPADLDLPLVLSPDADFNLPVRFSPDICFDMPEERTLRITSDDPGEPAVDVNVSGVAPCPNLVVDPVSLAGLYSFPATVVDTGGTLNCFSDSALVLRNNSICPLTITSISAAGDDYIVTQPTVFPVLLPGGEETLKVDVRFLPQSDANPLMPGEITGQLTVVSDDPDGDAVAGLCGESVAQSGVRILVTDQSGPEPQPLDMVERITLKSQGIHTPAPVNLVFTDQALLSATVCGNEILYHVNQETLPATDTVHNPNSSYDAKAKDGNLQAIQNFDLGQCEFRDFQLQLDDADSPDCLLLPKGAPCTSDGECCSGKCKGPNGRKTCK